MEPHSSDMKHKINEEKLFKQKVLQSAEAVRKKVKLIRDVKSNDNIMLEAMLKPITDPLSEMVKNNNSSNDGNNLNISDTEFDNNRLKWNKPVKKLKYSSSEDGMKESLDNKTLLRNSSESELNDSDSKSDESDNQSDSDTADNASFRTIDSYASPREDPAWQKQYFNMNIPFGVRNERGKLMLGSYPISVNDDKLMIGEESFFLTQGLNDLLFKKVPNLKLVTEDDIRSFKTLLLKTNAHRRDFDPNKPIKSNKGMKYLYVIKPLFKLSKQRTVSEELYISGKGLPSKKKVKTDLSYVYWDDPNELVERLKLLIASRDAGNTGLGNEIISIIEELREAGLTNNI